MRVIASGICLALVVFLVFDHRSGGFEYVLALLGAMGVFLGLPALAKLIRKE